MNDFPIIDKLGGRDAVYAHLRTACGIRTQDALRMWRSRRSIPTKPMRALMALAEAKGIAYSLSDFDLRASDGSAYPSADECVT